MTDREYLPRAAYLQSPVYNGEYRAGWNDAHLDATEPLEAERCACEWPLGIADDLGDPRCFRCGLWLGSSGRSPAG